MLRNNFSHFRDLGTHEKVSHKLLLLQAISSVTQNEDSEFQGQSWVTQFADFYQHAWKKSSFSLSFKHKSFLTLTEIEYLFNVF